MSKNGTDFKVLIDRMLRAYGLDNRLDEMTLIKSWEDVVGKMISKYTANIFVKNRILCVKINSSTVRQELTYIKDDLVIRLNKKAGRKVIDDIRLN